MVLHAVHRHRRQRFFPFGMLFSSSFQFTNYVFTLRRRIIRYVRDLHRHRHSGSTFTNHRAIHLSSSQGAVNFRVDGDYLVIFRYLVNYDQSTMFFRRIFYRLLKTFRINHFFTKSRSFRTDHFGYVHGPFGRESFQSSRDPDSIIIFSRLSRSLIVIFHGICWHSTILNRP